MNKIRSRVFSNGQFPMLVGLGLTLILSGYAQQRGPLNIDVYVPPGSSASTLTSDDFEVRLDGEILPVVSVERSTRPLNIVLLFVTNWAGCLDNWAPFSATDKISEVFGKDDQVAVVVSDRDGSIIRGLSKPGISLSTDLTDAIRITSRNSYEELNLESGISESKPGATFPMKGLQTSLGLLSDSSGATGKVIVLVNDLKNSDEGTRVESRNAVSTIVEQKVSVSWLATREFRNRFSLAEPPYGQREFFFGLPNFSGGVVKNCREKNSSFENNIQEILVRHRDRYRLQLPLNRTSGSALRSVAVRLKKAGHLDASLIYPKAISVE